MQSQFDIITDLETPVSAYLKLRELITSKEISDLSILPSNKLILKSFNVSLIFFKFALEANSEFIINSFFYFLI